MDERTSFRWTSLLLFGAALHGCAGQPPSVSATAPRTARTEIAAAISSGQVLLLGSRWAAGYTLETSLWETNEVHPRTLADLDGDGLPDIVGFGNTVSCVSLNLSKKGKASLEPECSYTSDFFSKAGPWQSGTMPTRMVADVNGDRKADLVAFGPDGVYVSLNLFSDTVDRGTFFAPPERWTEGYGAQTGWGDMDAHPRMLVDVNGDGRADIVGFGNGAVCVSLALADGSYQGECAHVLLYQFARYDWAGGWTSNHEYPRMLADVNGDSIPDIVGFGPHSVMVAVGTGDGTFEGSLPWVRGYGTDYGWEDTDRYPRMLVDVNGDGRADIVGFGASGVCVSISLGSRFTQQCDPEWSLIGAFGTLQGYARNGEFPRVLADVDGNGYPDIVGFGPDGVWVAMNLMPIALGFGPPVRLGGGFVNERTVDGCTSLGGAWNCQTGSVTPAPAVPRWIVRTAMDMDGDGAAEVVGIGDDGVIVARLISVSQTCQQAARVDTDLVAIQSDVAALTGLGVRNISLHLSDRCDEHLARLESDGTPFFAPLYCFDDQGFDRVAANERPEEFEPKLIPPVDSLAPHAPMPPYSGILVRTADRMAGFFGEARDRNGNPALMIEREDVSLCNERTGQNVVATRIGTDHPLEFIEVVAHLDSHPHSPGAGDDASGSAAMIELARLVSGLDPRHSFRFISLVGHEERAIGDALPPGSPCGNQGSVRHIQLVEDRNARGAGETILMVLNLDGVGYSPPEDPRSNVLGIAPFREWDRMTFERLANVSSLQGFAGYRIADIFDDLRSTCGIDITTRKATKDFGDQLSYWWFEQGGSQFDVAKPTILGRPFYAPYVPVDGPPAIFAIGQLPYSAPGYHNVGDVPQEITWPTLTGTTKQAFVALMALDRIDGKP
jgi:hypothetical protein